MISDQHKAAAEAYITALEHLSADNVAQLEMHLHEEFRFIDPFHDVVGRKAGVAIFADLFQRTQSVSFEAQRSFWTGNGMAIRWVMVATMNTSRILPKIWTIEGMSEIDVAPDGKIILHRDYWDSGQQFYGHFPLLGSVIKVIQRKVASGQG